MRGVSARALGAMVKGMGEQSFDELLPWLMSTLTSESSSVDRSGAAQGLAEVVGGVRTVNPTSGGSSSGVLRMFISLLSCHDLVRLRDRYWPDLLLFQYNISEMFQWTRGGKPGGCS